MNRITCFALLCATGIICGCSAVGSRIVGDRYFSGVRVDYAMIFDRERFDPSSRIHPALAAIDTPFSLVGDVLFLPYDAYESCETVSNTSPAAN
jgi:uncharacterized protein YceK